MAAVGTAEGGMDPALYKAATQGCVGSLRKLVVKDVEILNSKTPQRNTALHLAALHGHPKFAREVLAVSKELIVAKNADGDTALHLAAKTGRLKVAELLVALARGWPEDPNSEDALLKSPLIATNKEGNNPLHEAVRCRRTAVALALLDADPSRAYDLNEKMESPLHMAAREGLVHVVRKMFEFTWFDTEYVPSASVSGTALHQAVLGGHIKVVEIMLEKHIWLLDMTDSNGNNALHYAAQKNNSHVVELLLNMKTQLAYTRNREQQSPLHVAAQYGSTAAIKALLRYCSDAAEMVDGNGRNAFHASVDSGKANALRCLLCRVRPEQLLNRADKNGDTPLHLAARMNRVHCALVLLKDRRVDPCIRNEENQTARSLVEVRLNTGEMDAHEMYLWKQLKRQESTRCLKQQLPPVTFTGGSRSSSHKYFERSVETYILVATLIATVTFAATFTMPGGYDQNSGIALHGHDTAFKIFVISNTVAMCSSIVVVYCFIWAWKNPLKFKVDKLLWGHRLTMIAGLGMLVSLMAAVYITVAPTSRWPAYVVIAIGMSTPVVVVLMLGKEVVFVPL
ncbi:hypothetical protein SEVIR_9G100100v4 [Setaria viridis]|uniref:PGG domain-containing protein n=1 Tax=Setaria viridis TaxID=4556 RepID=A0A4U6STG9_SETVI|nr:ankyrin repeat-containing protein ITN1-like [Setaria viridis]TKV91494.1 hypothetical protein SEVIR_9G100100v2 [Setaria viridis]